MMSELLNIPNPFPRVTLTSYEYTPETKARIERVQKRLDDAGTKSIHFSPNYEELAKGNHSISDIANSYCDMIEAVLDGNVEPLEFIDEGVDPEKAF